LEGKDFESLGITLLKLEDLEELYLDLRETKIINTKINLIITDYDLFKFLRAILKLKKLNKICI